MYFNPLLKESFGYSAEDIIFHNFLLSILLCIANSVWAALSYRIHPLKILKVRGIVFLLFAIALPYLIMVSTHYVAIFLLQASILILTLGGIPADSVFIRHFPVFKRFTVTSFLYALTRAVMYIITSFGLVFLSEHWGYWALLIIILPVTIGYLWGVRHFQELENMYRLPAK
jgi:hypothetical protein